MMMLEDELVLFDQQLDEELKLSHRKSSPTVWVFLLVKLKIKCRSGRKIAESYAVGGTSGCAQPLKTQIVGEEKDAQ